MTPEQRDCILSVANDGSSAHKLLDSFGAPDGRSLGVALLRHAIAQRDDPGVELALIVCFTFGITDAVLPLLLELAPADWHHSHEDVASALDDLRVSAGVDALTHLTQWVPDYLDFDDSRALATKAIWALGNTPGAEATDALQRALDSDSEIVRDGARDQLERRAERAKPAESHGACANSEPSPSDDL